MGKKGGIHNSSERVRIRTNYDECYVRFYGHFYHAAKDLCIYGWFMFAVASVEPYDAPDSAIMMLY